ncbi:MAG TPA: gamma-glutamyltransferase [Oligoflexus sp.]|uniref:gamma-glutamyltransferase n=1 Tax=Oligoflexus sp. TaxID=1971216 RepID=UPI002D493275|nr:gamma-glutamyltransferase [Oligoflexus sp.]HYX37486.1 gamma-glutamyltransferase [Oligoflexus sp.]
MKDTSPRTGLFPSQALATLVLWLSLPLYFLQATWLHGATRAPVWGQRGLVATVSPLASEAGATILRQGGNAADAAVAVGFALAVTWPAAGNLGGGGFALVRGQDGKSTFIDYRETAPAAADKNFYLDAKGEVIPGASTVGYRAVGTPGTVAGMAMLHKKYGKLPWKKVLEPARRLAIEGFVMDESFVSMLESNKERLEKFPGSRHIFLKDGKGFKAGDRLVQPELGWSITQIQRQGESAFYQGEIAQRLAKAIKKGGGVLTLDDLKNYKAVERAPLEGRFKNYQIITAPPPSSGGALILAMLGMLEKDDLEALGFGSAAYNHLLVETMKRAFADRAEWFGDPDFTQNPLQKFLAPDYLSKRRAGINLTKTTPSQDIKPGDFSDKESTETTHYTIVDAQGMIISNTYTLNGSFGSGATADGTGILLNNEMDDFSSKPGSPNMYGLLQGDRNAIAPKKRPLSSMTPTIVLEDGKPILALGSPGGPTIINSVFQVTLNTLVFGMNIQAAIDAPKFHHQWMPDRILSEPFGINPDTKKIMQSMGHNFGDRVFQFGDVQAVFYDKKRQQWSGGSDSRHGGSVAVE